MSEEQASKYWVVVSDDKNPPPPELRSFDTFEEMAEFMRGVNKNQKTAWCLPFYGTVLSMAEGLHDSSLKFLVNSSGTPVPLFDAPMETKEPTTGFYSPLSPDYIDPASVEGGSNGDQIIGGPIGGMDYDDDSSELDFDGG